MSKKIGYAVVTEGLSGATLVKLYDNFEDADKHFEWQAKNPFAKTTKLHRCGFDIFEEVLKERNEDEKPEPEPAFVESEEVKEAFGDPRE